MKSKVWILAAACAVFPAIAEDVSYNRHQLDVAREQDPPAILRMAGTVYAVNATAASLIDKAQRCLADAQAGAIESADPQNGVLVATRQADYSVRFTKRSIRSKLTLVASDGQFQLVHTELKRSEAALADSKAEDFQPLAREGDWDKALDAMIDSEQPVIDCLYR